MRASDFWNSPAAVGLLNSESPDRYQSNEPEQQRIARYIAQRFAEHGQGVTVEDIEAARVYPRGHHRSALQASLDYAVAAGLLTKSGDTYSPASHKGHPL